MKEKLVSAVKFMGYGKGFVIKTFFPIETLLLIVALGYFNVSIWDSIICFLGVFLGQLIFLNSSDDLSSSEDFDIVLISLYSIIFVLINLTWSLAIGLLVRDSIVVCFLVFFSLMLIFLYLVFVQYVLYEREIDYNWNSIYLWYVLRKAKSEFKRNTKSEFLTKRAVKDLLLINATNLFQLLEPNYVIHISEENMEKLSTLSLTFQGLEKKASSYNEDRYELSSLFDTVLNSIKQEAKESNIQTEESFLDELQIKNNKEALEYARRKIEGK